MESFSRRPAYTLLLIALCSLLLMGGAARFAQQQPWLGVRLAAIAGKAWVVEDAAHQLLPGTEVRRVAGIELLPSDLIDNTDTFLSYADKQQFFERQDALAAALHSGSVTLHWVAKDNSEQVTTITPRTRTLAELSTMFWFTLSVAYLCFIISCWVFLMRPQDWGSRMFALTGLPLLIGCLTSALISERALALDAHWFGILDKTNSLAGILLGASLVALFLSYPRQLVAPKKLLWLLVLYLPWWFSDQLQLLPSPDWGVMAIILSQLVASFVCSLVQWRVTAEQPLERAALRWFALSVLLGSSLFAFTNMLPRLFGMPELMTQGYAIGFFLIMYVGIALGLRRYRLFDMDEWSYRVLLWVMGAISVIALDGVLIFSGLTEATSLGISLLLVGWLYFPMRQWLWRRIVSKRRPNFESLLPELSAIAFSPTGSAQRERWEALLRHLYDPLELMSGETDGGGIREEGLAMQVPGCGNLPSYLLRYPGHGARLFSSRDATFAASLSHLLERVLSGRSSYEQGVAQERLRLGRDLHDNIGARLLKLIHHLRGTPDAEIARDAMKDLRTSIAAMDTQPVPLPNALADWRAETGSRCEAASCRLQWRQPDELPAVELAPRTKAMLESVVREIVTNALKHAAPKLLDVEIAADEHQLRATVSNDGAFADPLTWKSGYGLRNMRGRLEELGGRLQIAAATDKVQLIAEVPLT